MGDAGGGDEAAEATRVFESLYGTDLKAVRETPAPQDDLELGKRLLAAADQAKGQPAFLAVLLERAADLAEVHPDGYETAIGALVRLSEAIPEKAGAAAGRVVAIRQKQFSAARGADRSKAGEALIDALLASADWAENAGDLSDAETLLRRAQRVGRSVRSDRLSGIDARLSRVAHAIQTATSIAQHKDRLAKDPANHGARAELVRLLLVDADDPAEAARYAGGLEDESMRANVLAAAKGADAADEAASMSLGDWYRSLGETAADEAKPAMLARAKACYERFLALHTAQDLQHTAATLALKKVEAQLQKLGGAPQPVDARGKWIDLLRLIDPLRDTVAGTWQRQDTTLSVSPTDWARVTLPVMPEGSYQLQMEFLRVTGGEEFNEVFVILPVGSSRVACLLSASHGQVSGLGMIDGKWPSFRRDQATVRPGALTDGRLYALHIEVLVRDGLGRISVLLDGQPYLKWEGPQSALSIADSMGVPNRKALGLGCRTSRFTFTSLRLRMLSGKANVVTADEPAGAAKATSPAEPTPPVTRKTVVKAGESAELLPLVDCAKDVKEGVWRRDADELLLEDGYWAHIQLPAAPRGSYELQVKFTRTAGSQDIPLHLPVGNSRVMLNMNRSDSAGLGLVSGKDAHENESSVHYGKRLTNNALHTLTVKVVVKGSLAAIDAQLDGPDKRRVQWQGPWSALSVGAKHAINDRRLLGLAAHRANIRYHAVRLTMLSGEAQLLR